MPFENILDKKYWMVLDWDKVKTFEDLKLVSHLALISTCSAKGLKSPIQVDIEICPELEHLCKEIKDDG